MSGTVVELKTAEEIVEFAKGLNDELIINADTPWWADTFYAENGKTSSWVDEDDLEDNYLVGCLPENWKQLSWLEVYNGLRE